MIESLNISPCGEVSSISLSTNSQNISPDDSRLHTARFLSSSSPSSLLRASLLSRSENVLQQPVADWISLLRCKWTQNFYSTFEMLNVIKFLDSKMPIGLTKDAFISNGKFSSFFFRYMRSIFLLFFFDTRSIFLGVRWPMDCVVQ